MKLVRSLPEMCASNELGLILSAARTLKHGVGHGFYARSPSISMTSSLDKLPFPPHSGSVSLNRMCAYAANPRVSAVWHPLYRFARFAMPLRCCFLIFRNMLAGFSRFWVASRRGVPSASRHSFSRSRTDIGPPASRRRGQRTRLPFTRHSRSSQSAWSGITGPLSVIAIVCSKWAQGLPSFRS